MNARGVFLDVGGTLVEPLKPERLDETSHCQRVRLMNRPLA
jgi:hypothetical protein